LSEPAASDSEDFKRRLGFAEEHVLMLLAVNSLPRMRHLCTRRVLSGELWPDVADRAFQSLREKGLIVEDKECFEITEQGRKVLYR
jgi:hypothetical protein